MLVITQQQFRAVLTQLAESIRDNAAYDHHNDSATNSALNIVADQIDMLDLDWLLGVRPLTEDE